MSLNQHRNGPPSACRRTKTTPQRIDAEPESHRQNLWWLVAIPVGLMIAMFFIGGPNGLVRLYGHWRDVRTNEQKLNALQKEIDSLQQLQIRFSDPDFVGEYATGLLGTEPDSGPGRNRTTNQEAIAVPGQDTLSGLITGDTEPTDHRPAADRPDSATAYQPVPIVELPVGEDSLGDYPADEPKSAPESLPPDSDLDIPSP